MPRKSMFMIGDRNSDLVDEGLVGGKGFNLVRLQRLGMPVPRFCILASNVFRDAIHPHQETIRHTLKGIDYTSHASVSEASAQITNLIRDFVFPLAIADELFQASSTLFAEGGTISVRSSVVGEDSQDNSFAGLMDSYLHVTQGNLLDSIKKVWASAFSERALMYRHKKNIGVNEIASAVIIQQMVDSFVSGILFTRDPDSEELRSIISAGYGLGEGVVSNRVETDTYLIDRKTRTITRDISTKTVRMTHDRVIGHGTIIVPVSPELQSKPALSDTQTRELYEVGMRIEKALGVPQDIEWAFDERGKLFILQARPVVGLREQSASNNVQVWDNSNIVESYPGITLPLTFSVVREGYENTFRQASAGLLPFKKKMVRELSFFRSMIGLLDGRIYYNLLNWYRMLSYLPGFKKRKEAWDQMIGISQKMEFERSRLSFADKLVSALVTFWKLLTLRRNGVKFFAMFRPFHERFRKIKFEGKSEFDLLSTYEDIRTEFNRMWHLTLYNDLAAMSYYDWLKRLCSKWGLDGYPNLHNDLLCGEQGVESVEPLRSMVRIATMIRSTSPYNDLFMEEDETKVWGIIRTDKCFSDLKDVLDEHLDQYGDRGLEELKLENPSLRENPATVLHLIRTYMRLQLTVETMELQEREIRMKAERHVKSHLRAFWKRMTFGFILSKARRAIANRENMRFARSRLYGILRRLFQRMGALLAQKGMLDSQKDVFYLTVEEVFGLLHATGAAQNLREIVAIRKREYSDYSTRTLNERIVTDGIPMLTNLSGTVTTSNGSTELRGIGCSSGTVQGEAKIVLDPASVNGDTGYILVAQSTDPGWVFLIISSKGIIVEKGSVLSHTAIIGRELGIPTIVGVKNATQLIPDGALVTLDGREGVVRW